MADKTLYSWSNIVGGKKPAKPGDKVTQEGLGVSDEDWQYFLDEKIVRETPYPDLGAFPGSPVELSKAQLAAAAGGGYFDTQYGRVAAEDADLEEATKVEAPKK